nr:hypothetical protein [Tanacetum cinerariifolium]
AIIPRRSNRRRVPNIVEPEIRTIVEIVLMADRTMEELLQTLTEGYGEAIVILEILVENFEIKTNLLQLVQANKFHGFERDNPHTHISNLKRMTATLKYRDVPNDAIKLMLFPYSLEGAARIWDNVSKTDDRIDKLADQISNLVEIVNKQVIAPASAIAVEKTCVTYEGAHAYYDCIATDSNQPSACVTTGSLNQNQTSTLGTLLSNTVPNPKCEMKAVTSRSGLAYEGPSIPTNSPLEKVDEQNTEEIMNKEHSNCQGSTTQVQPSVVPISIPVPDVPRTQTKPTILYPSRLNDQKATNQMEKFFQIFHDLHFDISFADALLLMPKFASKIKSLFANKDKLFELAKVSLNESCSAMLLKKLPEKLGDLELTPTRMTLELADRSITHPKGVAEDVFVKVGKFHFPTDFVVVDFEADPRVPLILGRSFLRTGRALIDAYGEEITLKYNPKSSNPTLVSDPSVSECDFSKEPIVKSSSPTPTPFGEKYAFLEDSNKFPVIIAKDIKDVKKEALINVLKSHKRAIAWKISDIKGINPRFCTHKILMEDDYKPAAPSQRRVNPKIHDVIKKEVIKLLDAGMIYPISDSPLGEPNPLCSQKGRKDHFPLPFMDQMLERLVRNEFYCFLDGFSGYFQVPIDP